jgi:hypothetical protein
MSAIWQKIKNEVWIELTSNSKKVFVEDEVIDGESADEAFERLYGVKRKTSSRLLYIDYGDHMINLYKLEDKRLIVVLIDCYANEIWEYNGEYE